MPSIETEILTVLDPAQRENALAFTAYLRENGLTPRRWFGPGFWIVPSENGNLFGIHFYGFGSSPARTATAKIRNWPNLCGRMSGDA